MSHLAGAQIFALSEITTNLPFGIWNSVILHRFSITPQKVPIRIFLIVTNLFPFGGCRKIEIRHYQAWRNYKTFSKNGGSHKKIQHFFLMLTDRKNLMENMLWKNFHASSHKRTHYIKIYTRMYISYYAIVCAVCCALISILFCRQPNEIWGKKTEFGKSFIYKIYIERSRSSSNSNSNNNKMLEKPLLLDIRYKYTSV